MGRTARDAGSGDYITRVYTDLMTVCVLELWDGRIVKYMCSNLQVSIAVVRASVMLSSPMRISLKEEETSVARKASRRAF